MPDASDETIFAPATGYGRAAIAVVRISGPACAAVLAALGGAVPTPRRLVLRRLRDPAGGAVLDQALVAFLPGPGSFTGEDMAELHLHGGIAVRSGVLRALGDLPGCRAALPGEFSRRAVMNGRIDLTEAEGIADLIDAETEAQRVQALRQLDGALGRQVAAWRVRIVDLLASAEAALDFSDEGDVDDGALGGALAVGAAALHDEIDAVLADGRRGERLRDGFTVVLAGPPNAGKSTLLNALSRREAAIVSAQPGTTRDAIEVRCDLGGLPVVLVDTAGLRETDDVVEAEGIRRTRARMATADLVLDLRPADEAPGVSAAHADEGLSALAQDPRGTGSLRVWTKSDLGVAPPGALAVCALAGTGLDGLLAAIEERVQEALGGGDALVTRERHRLELERCRGHLARVARAEAGLPELVAEDLRLAVRALGAVAGQVGVEEMLDRLFSGFCIGK